MGSPGSLSCSSLSSGPSRLEAPPTVSLFRCSQGPSQSLHFWPHESGEFSLSFLKLYMFSACAVFLLTAWIDPHFTQPPGWLLGFFLIFQQLMRLEWILCVPTLQKVILWLTGPLSQGSDSEWTVPCSSRGRWSLSFLTLWSLSTVSISFATTVCPRASTQLTWLCCLGALFVLLLRKLGDSHPGALVWEVTLGLGFFFLHSHDFHPEEQPRSLLFGGVGGDRSWAPSEATGHGGVWRQCWALVSGGQGCCPGSRASSHCVNTSVRAWMPFCPSVLPPSDLTGHTAYALEDKESFVCSDHLNFWN